MATPFGLQEISTRAQHITDAAAQSLVDRALALGVKLAKESVQRVRRRLGCER